MPDMTKRKVIKETWQIDVPIVYAMGSICFLHSAMNVSVVFDAIRTIQKTRSYDGNVLINCTDEDQCDILLGACEDAKRLMTNE